MIDEKFKGFADKYLGLKESKYISSPATELLTHDIPELLYSSFDLDKSEFLIKGSVGTGQWADVPWVCVMHKGVTDTTRNGYYVAILFSSDMKNLFTTVGLGWTQFQERYGNKLGKDKVKSFANKLSNSLQLEKGETKGIIDLNATTSLSKGYEYSNITSIKLGVENLSRRSFAEAFEKMLSHYEYLRNELGSDIFYDSYEEHENEPIDTQDFKSQVKRYSSFVNKASALKVLVSIAELEPPARKKVLTSKIIRNRAFADFVKERAGYVCEICGKRPFKKQNGRPYAEADHIDMLGDIGKDHPDNMRCLCAQCHRVITYGSDAEINMLKPDNRDKPA